MEYLNKLNQWLPLKNFERTHKIYCDGNETIIKSIDSLKEGRFKHDGTRSIYKAKGRILKHTTRPDGYKNVRICTYHWGKNIQVHRLIAIQFIPNPENKPFINHINGIKDDNRIENLEWCTTKENSIHAVKMGLQYTVGELNPHSKLKNIQVIDIKKLLNLGKLSQTEISKMYNVSCSVINRIHLNKTYKCVFKKGNDI